MTPILSPTTTPVEMPTIIPIVPPSSNPTATPTPTPTPCGVCPPIVAPEPETELDELPPKPDPARFEDDDGDGVLNGEEDDNGTERDNPDTDGDEYSDGEELHADRLSGLLPSDPNDPQSIPHEAVQDVYGTCERTEEVEEEDEQWTEHTDLRDVEEDEETESMCSETLESDEPKKDPELYTDPVGLGPTGGFAADPCRTEYTYCIAGDFQRFKLLQYRIWLRLSFQLWMRNLRSCVPGCPSAALTKFTETGDCATANLRVIVVEDGGTKAGPTRDQPGRATMYINRDSDDHYAILHEMGHVFGLEHVTRALGEADGPLPPNATESERAARDDLYWAGQMAAEHPIKSLSPIMSYGNAAYKERKKMELPDPVCLHPTDSERLCKLVAQVYVKKYQDRVCGKKKPCCLEDGLVKSIVGETAEGTKRTCYSTIDPVADQKVPPPIDTICQAEDDVCMACINKEGKQIPWNLQAVPVTHKDSPNRGRCWIAPYCAPLDEYYPRTGMFYDAPAKDADGNPLCSLIGSGPNVGVNR